MSLKYQFFQKLWSNVNEKMTYKDWNQVKSDISDQEYWRAYTNTPWVRPHNKAIELLCKIKMPKSTTGCRIKSFIPVEKTYVEKLRDI